MKKIITIVCMGLFLFSTALAGINDVTDVNTLSPLTYSFDKPIVKKIIIGEDIYDKVILKGAPSTSNPNEPCLPAKGAYILTAETNDSSGKWGHVNHTWAGNAKYSNGQYHLHPRQSNTRVLNIANTTDWNDIPILRDEEEIQEQEINC